MHPKRREERAKLLATFLSNLGIAAVVTGLIGPIFLGGLSLTGALAAAEIGLALHVLGQIVLEFVVSDEDERRD